VRFDVPPNTESIILGTIFTGYIAHSQQRQSTQGKINFSLQLIIPSCDNIFNSPNIGSKIQANKKLKKTDD